MLNKTIMLITGASKGIGKYLVEYYTKKDFFVIGCSRSKIDFQNDNYVHYQLSVDDEKSVMKMFSKIRLKYKRLDII